MNQIYFFGINHNCVLKPTTKEGRIAMYKKLLKYGGKCPICEKYGYKKPTVLEKIKESIYGRVNTETYSNDN